MSKELGTLVVVVLKAKNLYDKHSFYKQDPFAQISLDGKTHRTEVDIKGGQHPEWDAEFRLPIVQSKDEKHRKLEIICFRQESRKEEEIGKGTLDITNTIKTGEFDDWIDLKDSGGVYKGEIYLEMTFYASGPPPLDRRTSKLKPDDRLTRLAKPGPSEVGNPPNAGKYLTPIATEAPLPPLPASEESDKPARVPTVLRPGPRASGPASAHPSSAHDLSTKVPGARSSSQSPPRSGIAIPASLAPGQPNKSHIHNRKPSVPLVDNSPVLHSPHLSSTGFGESSVPANGTNSDQQHVKRDYRFPEGYQLVDQPPGTKLDHQPGPSPQSKHSPSPAEQRQRVQSDYSPPASYQPGDQSSAIRDGSYPATSHRDYSLPPDGALRQPHVQSDYSPPSSYQPGDRPSGIRTEPYPGASPRQDHTLSPDGVFQRSRVQSDYNFPGSYPSGDQPPEIRVDYQPAPPLHQDYNPPINASSHHYQHTENDYGPPVGYEQPPGVRYGYQPSASPHPYFSPPPVPVQDHQPRPIEFSPTLFPTPRIVVDPIPESYSASLIHSSVPPFQVQASYNGGYTPQPMVYPPSSPYHIASQTQQPYQYPFRPPTQTQSSFYRPPEISEHEFPDPHLMARYSSPLPLPPGQERNSYRAAPNPPHEPVHVHRPPPAMQHLNMPQRSQEDLDLELARKLDMELNLVDQ